MTLQEFKAWFEGFTEAMDDTPTPKQWKRIKARVGEINGTAITYAYWPYYVQSYPSYPTTTGHTVTISRSSTAASSVQSYHGATQTFDSHTAMYALGKSDSLTS